MPLNEFRKLSHGLEPVKLTANAGIYATESAIEHVYFPETCLISLATEMQDGTTVEMGIVGRRGFAGLPVFLGSRTAPSSAFVQIPGDSLRMSVRDFQRFVTPTTRLHERLLRYTQSFLVQTGQGAACNALHTPRQRCARWLLMVSDQTGTSRFELTHAFLAQMLGVRPAGAASAEESLRQKGVIESSDGTVSIRDRPGLEAAACECYQIIRGESERLLV